MNLLNLYVKLSVDTGQYDESIEKVRSSAEKVSKNFDTVQKKHPITSKKLLVPLKNSRLPQTTQGIIPKIFPKK